MRKTSILLFHGLGDSPDALRLWRQTLADAYPHAAIHTPLLPGHYGDWWSIGKVSLQRYREFARHAYDAAAAEGGDVIVGGVSFGGALAIDVASSPDADRIRGALLVNPVVSHPSKMTSLARLFKYVKQSINSSGPFQHDETLAYTHENRLAMRSVATMNRYWSILHKQLEGTSRPIVVFNSKADGVVGEHNMEVLRSTCSNVTVVDLPNAFHMAVLDDDREVIFTESNRFIASVTGSAARH